MYKINTEHLRGGGGVELTLGGEKSRGLPPSKLVGL